MLDMPPESAAFTLIGSNFPNLARGAEAKEKRRSEMLGTVQPEYDGYIWQVPGSTAGSVLPRCGPVFSASGLQTLGACPRRYFYRYVLGLDEPRETPPPSEWLDAAEKPEQLLHDVLHKFLARLGRT